MLCFEKTVNIPGYIEPLLQYLHIKYTVYLLVLYAHKHRKIRQFSD